MSIPELKEGLQELSGIIQTRSPLKSYTRHGSSKKFFNFTFQDEFGRYMRAVSFAEEHYSKIEPQQTYNFKNIEVKYSSYSKELEMIVSSSSTITPTSSDSPRLAYIYTKIADLPAMKTANILSICVGPPEMRTVTQTDRELQLYKIAVRDQTGTVNLIQWGKPFNFKTDDIVAAHHVTIKNYKNTFEAQIGNDTTLDINPDNEQATELIDWYNSHQEEDSCNISYTQLNTTSSSSSTTTDQQTIDDIQKDIEDTENQIEALTRKRRRLQIELQHHLNLTKF